MVKMGEMSVGMLDEYLLIDCQHIHPPEFGKIQTPRVPMMRD